MARRVLVVDDHPGFRAAARRMLTAEGFEVVGEAPTGEAALDAAREHEPDIVLLDIQLPGIDGLAVAELLAELDPAPAVVLVSSRPAATYRRRLSAASVAGFIAKAELTGASVSALVDR
jgi:DNA-binding NarL/FixJ family response regulator